MSMTVYNPDDGIDVETFDKEGEIARFAGIDTQGFQLLVRLYIPPRKIGSILLADTTHDDFQYRACTALVVQKGRDSYGERFDTLTLKNKVWCDIGDWVIFPRHEGIQLKIDGKPCQFLNDASVLAKVDDPRRIVR